MASKTVVCIACLRLYSAYSYPTYPSFIANIMAGLLSKLGQRERRMVPYVLSILCYFTCYYIMSLLHLPHMLTSILMVALIIQILCAVINVWWKISTHTAAIGGVTGSLIAFSLLFNFNPMWWLCLTIVVSGLVGSSRMILRQHSLEQVTAGFFLGLVSSFLIIIIV